VQDNRLVVLNARDAEAHGADIRTRTRCTRAVREAGTWRLSLENLNAGTVETIRAKALVNAAGPWVDRVLATAIGRNAPGSVRLVQGSHIVVPKLYDHDRCYIFQNPDGRIVFAIPYEDDFTLIGTTDVDYAGDPAAVAITQTEVDYLRAAASAYFDRTIAPGDVVWTYSGVRPLYDDGKANAQETTRDYVLTLDGDASQPPLLNIFGGKITTYRCLAEEALARLSERFPDWAHGHGWTKSKHLPGGDFPMGEADRVAAGLRRDYPFLTEKASRRLVRHYGSEARRILGAARSLSELGVAFGPELTEAECRYLIDHEYAQEAADIAFRRTKAGIRMSREELEALDRWMSAIRVPKSAPKGVVNG
jgi:glycerol-3-phosphate dehydrogenase